MKLYPNNGVRPGRASSGGFTLVEMYVAVAIFMLVILATVAMQVYAMRVYTLAATKLSATTGARMALNDIRDKIRNAQLVYVGNYTVATGNPVQDFTPIADGNLQQGNAVMIYPSASSTNTFTLLFLQPGNGGTSFATMNSSGQIINTNSLLLQIYTNGALQVNESVVSFITNQYVFQAQDFQNNVLTNNVNNRVIQIQMFFSQWEYPIAMIGTNTFNAYDYYRVQTRVTRRLVD